MRILEPENTDDGTTLTPGSCVGNISVGRMKVVELGPKFAKKRINAYVTVKPACIPGLD